MSATHTTRHDTTATERDTTNATVAETAAALGITPTAVRKRLERGQLRGRKVAGQWTIDLAGDATNATQPVARDATTRPRRRDTTRQGGGEAAVLRERLAAVERERDALAADKQWLQTQLEEQTRAAAESRVLLLRAQAQLPPAQDAATRAEKPEKPPAMVETAPTPTTAVSVRGFWARLFGR